jgi:arylsulfatase A-like enzyme
MESGVTYTNAIAPGTWTGSVHASLFTNRRVTEIPDVSQDFFDNGTYKIDPWMAKTKFLPDGSKTLAGKLSQQGYFTLLVSNNPFLNSFTNLSIGFDSIIDVWKHSNIKYDKRAVEMVSSIIDGGSSAKMAMYNISNALTSLLPKPVFDKLYLYLRIKLDERIARADGTNRLDKGASDTNLMLKRYLKGYSGMPHFLFVNFMEAHENYPTADKSIIPDKWLYLSGIRSLEKGVTDRLHDAYKKRIRYLDGKISKTIAIMKESGFLDNATLILASDHGQFFGEHGLLYHAMFPYEEVTKVPLVSVNFENGKMVKDRRVVDEPVNLMKLHDAILGIASGRDGHLNGNMESGDFILSEHTGIIEGWDEGLLKMLKDRSHHASRIYNAKLHFNQRVSAAYHRGYKLVRYLNTGRTELYNVGEDPIESENVLDENRAMAKSIIAHSW